jgi:threonine aldolase
MNINKLVPETDIHPKNPRMSQIDLRSDTAVLPSVAMRAAMSNAPVGDDQYGEDPSIESLQKRVAEMLGKEEALFMPSGTMTNQVALNLLTRPGDNVLIADEAHMVWNERGAAAAKFVQFTTIGKNGLFSGDDVRRAMRSDPHVVGRTTLVVVENTHNRAGGILFPKHLRQSVLATARAAGLGTYLDGARLLNAAASTSETLADLAEGFDLVGISLSKSLGCPIGSMLAGSSEKIEAAKTARRHFGGALRQTGILAAAGLYALDHNIQHLHEDHVNARSIAERIAGLPRITIDLNSVQTNVVTLRLDDGMPDAATIVRRARECGVLATEFGPRTIRVVTHLDVNAEQCRRAAYILVDILTLARLEPSTVPRKRDLPSLKWAP